MKPKLPVKLFQDKYIKAFCDLLSLLPMQELLILKANTHDVTFSLLFTLSHTKYFSMCDSAGCVTLPGNLMCHSWTKVTLGEHKQRR